MKKLFENLFNNARRGGQEEIGHENLLSDDSEERQFEHDFRKSLIELESQLHHEEDNNAIVMAAIRSAYDFYDADWAGILTTDSGSEMWSATKWISRKSGENVETLFDDEEYFENYPLWVNALKSGKPIVIEDVLLLPGISKIELSRYEKLEVHGVIGAPFGMRPQGFMVIKNPRRYKQNPDYLKMMAFVGLSSFYQQMLMDGVKMMRDDNKESTYAEDSVRINVFGVPELITSAGSINEQQFKSAYGWKLLTYMTIKNKSVPARVIATALWPDDNVETRTDTVRNVIYRFRSKVSFIETQPILVRDEIGYVFNPDLPITTDVQEFDSLWNEITDCPDDNQKLELLTRAVALYKGSIYAEFADEEWLMNDAHAYETRYIRMVGMLLELLADRRECQKICDVARESLKIVAGNVQAYYWLIIALNHMGAVESAKSEMEIMHQLVTEEEYQELYEKITNAIAEHKDCAD